MSQMVAFYPARPMVLLVLSSSRKPSPSPLSRAQDAVMAPPPPELMDDLVREILLRLPPDDPALLLRASLVCKPWRRLLTDPAFLRLYRAFHRTPPVLGFLHNLDAGSTLVPISSFRPPEPDYLYGHVLDCRHGCVLHRTTSDLLVWDPITAEEHRIPGHVGLWGSRAAVLCAIANCDHRDCHGSPFLVALVGVDYSGPELFTHGQVYSSEAGEWSTPTTMGNCFCIGRLPPALAGDAVYFICDLGSVILCYDIHGDRGLSRIDGPGGDYCGIALIPTLDGGLRFAGLNDCYSLDLWSLEGIGPEGVAGWTNLMKLRIQLPIDDDFRISYLVGSKGPDPSVLFVSTTVGIFMIELESHKVRKVYEHERFRGWYTIFPYTGFFTPDRAGRLSSQAVSL